MSLLQEYYLDLGKVGRAEEKHFTSDRLSRMERKLYSLYLLVFLFLNKLVWNEKYYYLLTLKFMGQFQVDFTLSWLEVEICWDMHR